MQLTGLTDIPQWYLEYKEFTETLLHRNAWFIKLRYAAVVILLIAISALFFFVSSAHNLVHFGLALIPVVFILFSNLQFYKLLVTQAPQWGYRELLRFSLMQVLSDLAALAMLTYLTGGVESLISILFVFHIIISALLFPQRLVIAISVTVILFYNTFAWLEYFTVIPHFNLGLLLHTPLYSNTAYVLFNTVLFSGVLCTSALLAFRIASDMILQQKALHDAYEKLETAENEKQQYVIAVVHEIKQPVTAVTSFLELVNQNYLGVVPEAIAQVLQKCINRNKDAVEMINSILKISRLKLMNLMNTGEVNLRQVIEQIIQRYEPLIERKKVVITRNLTDVPCLITGDEFLITLAVSNLLSNAVKYNHESGEITVTLQKAADQLILGIADTGIGIAPDELQKVSKDFFRASNLDGKNIEGAGVGLSVVRQIIEKHHGVLSMSSPSGIGSAEFPGTSVQLVFTLVHSK